MSRKIGIIVGVVVLVGILSAQGDPHYMWGYVINEGDGYPSAECLTYKAFLVGSSDTIFYPGDSRATYNESNGGWSVQIGGLYPSTGDIFVIIFSDTCEHTQGYDTAVVNMDSVSQGMGLTTLSVSAGISGGSLKAHSFGLTVSPSPFNSSCEISICGTGRVEVGVYNCLGNRVADIYSGDLRGILRVKWAPGDLPAGVYFIRGRIGGKSVVQRVLFLP